MSGRLRFFPLIFGVVERFHWKQCYPFMYSIGGSRGRAPLKDPILSFWHTNFTKHSRLGSPRLPLWGPRPLQEILDLPLYRLLKEICVILESARGAVAPSGKFKYHHVIEFNNRLIQQDNDLNISIEFDCKWVNMSIKLNKRTWLPTCERSLFDWHVYSCFVMVVGSFQLKNAFSETGYPAFYRW